MQNDVPFSHVSHISVNIRAALCPLWRPQGFAESMLTLLTVGAALHKSLLYPDPRFRVGFCDSLLATLNLSIWLVLRFLPHCVYRRHIEVYFLVRVLLL